MSDNLLTLDDVLGRTKLKRSTLYDHIRGGLFPAPLKIGWCSRWEPADIATWRKRLRAARGTPQRPGR